MTVAATAGVDPSSPRPATAATPKDDATGKTNVTTALNTFFAAQPPGTVINSPDGSRYRCDQTPTLLNNTNLTIHGDGAVIFTDDPTGDGSTLAAPSRAARTRGHFQIDGCTNITVDHLRIRQWPRPWRCAGVARFRRSHFDPLGDLGSFGYLPRGPQPLIFAHIVLALDGTATGPCSRFLQATRPRLSGPAWAIPASTAKRRPTDSSRNRTSADRHCWAPPTSTCRSPSAARRSDG